MTTPTAAADLGPAAAVAATVPPKGFLSPLNRRRWRNFRRNRRAYWSFIIFSALFVLSLFAEVLANDKPIILSYRGELRMPIVSFYSEADRKSVV